MKHLNIYQILVISLIVISFSCKKDEPVFSEKDEKLVELEENFKLEFEEGTNYRKAVQDGDFLYVHLDLSLTSSKLIKFNTLIGEVEWEWITTGTHAEKINDFRYDGTYISVQNFNDETFLLNKDNGTSLSSFTLPYIHGHPVFYNNSWIALSRENQKLNILRFDVSGTLTDTIYEVPQKVNYSSNLKDIQLYDHQGEGYVYFRVHLKDKEHETYEELHIINLTNGEIDIVPLGNVSEIEDVIIIPENEFLFVVIAQGRTYCVNLKGFQSILWSGGFNSAQYSISSMMNTDYLFVKSGNRINRIFKGNGYSYEFDNSNYSLLLATNDYVLLQDWNDFQFLKPDDGTSLAYSNQGYIFVDAYQFPSDLILGLNNEGLYGLKLNLPEK